MTAHPRPAAVSTGESEQLAGVAISAIGGGDRSSSGSDHREAPVAEFQKYERPSASTADNQSPLARENTVASNAMTAGTAGFITSAWRCLSETWGDSTATITLRRSRPS